VLALLVRSCARHARSTDRGVSFCSVFCVVLVC
jgi:hypothetical protein